MSNNALEMTWEELVDKAKQLGYEFEMFEEGHGLNMCKPEQTEGPYFYYDTTDKKSGGEIGVRIDSWSINWFAKNRTPSQMYQIMLALEN